MDFRCTLGLVWRAASIVALILRIIVGIEKQGRNVGWVMAPLRDEAAPEGDPSPIASGRPGARVASGWRERKMEGNGRWSARNPDQIGISGDSERDARTASRKII